MRIYINGRFLTQPITGVQRFAREIVSAFDLYIEDNKNNYEVIILVPTNTKYNCSFKNIAVKEVGNLKGHLWEQVELPFFTMGSLLINLCNVGPAFKRKQVAVIHDAAVYSDSDTYSFSFRLWYKFLYKSIALFSMKIITVSEFSKLELMKFLKLKRDKISVISEGKEHIERLTGNQSILTKFSLRKNEFVLAVSSMNPNKNFKSIVEAIDLISDTNIKVVIAGGFNEKVFRNKTEKFISEKVSHVGYVSDNELKTLYENAFCFVFPSYYEGFGLPPLEALACGCPVITSNTSSLPEVCGSAALYIDPNKPSQIADKISLLHNEPSIREDLSKKGIKQSEKFSWYKGVEELISIVNEVYK